MRGPGADRQLCEIVFDRILTRSDKAALICFGAGQREWLPYSQCPGLEEAEGPDDSVLVPEWLLEEKNLTGYTL